MAAPSLVRDSLVAPDGCQVRSVTLDASWEAWDRIVSELHAAGVEVDDHVVVGDFFWASAHYTAGDIRVMLASPYLEFDEHGTPLLDEATS